MPRKAAVRKKPTALWPYHHCTIASCTPEYRLYDVVLNSRPAPTGLKHMKNRSGKDESEVEPVGDIDMRLRTTHQRHHEHQQVQHQVTVISRSTYQGNSALLAFGDPVHVADDPDQHAQLPTPERQIGHPVAGRRA